MRLSTVITAVVSYAALTAAQDQTVQIVVGGEATTQGGALQFIPNNINATAGSTITFQFAGNPGNHSITQSSFASPCQPLSGGFDSGWVSIPAGTTDFPTFNLTVTDTAAPIWFYCKQLAPVAHCKSGMVGAINAPTTGNTFSNFQAAAVATSGNPGQGEGGLAGVGASASAPPGPLTGNVAGFGNPTAASGPAAPSSASSPNSPSSSSSGAPAPSQSSPPPQNGASTTNAGGVVMVLAALFGVVVA